jgi:hypothetical protein
MIYHFDSRAVRRGFLAKSFVQSSTQNLGLLFLQLTERRLDTFGSLA